MKAGAEQDIWRQERVLFCRILDRCFLITSLILALVLVANHASIRNAQAQDTRQYVPVLNAKVHYRHRASLKFLRHGIVSSISVQEGAWVSTGDEIASLEDKIPKAALAVARHAAKSETEIRIAEKQYESARLEYEAVVAANNRSAGAFSGTEVERTRLNMQKANLEIELQKHLHKAAILQEDQAKQELATYYLKAPFDGLITKVKLNLGEEISESDSLIELVDTKHVVSEGYVGFEQAKQIKSGAPVDIVVSGPTGTDSRFTVVHKGNLRFVDVSVQPVRGVVRVIADFENPSNNFIDGLVAEMRIYSSSNDVDDLSH